MVTSLDVLALIDSVGTSYPGGIPRGEPAPSVAVTAKSPGAAIRATGPTAAPLLFVGFSGAESLLHGPTGALLEAAVSKGLKIEATAVAYVAIPEGAKRAEIEATLGNFSAPIGIALGPNVGAVLGLAGSNGAWLELGGRAWRVTHDLSAVLADPSLKRPLWSDLQAVAQRLAERKG